MAAKKIEETKKEEKKMAEMLKSVEMKPKQSVLNLDTGAEEKVEITYNKYVPTKEGLQDVSAAIEAALAILTDPKAVLEAILYGVNNALYSAGKEVAFAGGNYVTSELRSRIVAFMRNQQQFAELSASDAWTRWLEGFKAKKPGAIKILEIVSADAEQYDL